MPFTYQSDEEIRKETQKKEIHPEIMKPKSEKKEKGLEREQKNEWVMKDVDLFTLMNIIKFLTIGKGVEAITIKRIVEYVKEANEKKLRLMLEELTIKEFIMIGEREKEETFRLIEPLDLLLPQPVIYSVLSVVMPFSIKTEKLKELEKEIYGDVRKDTKFIDVKKNFDDAMAMLINGRKAFVELFKKGKNKNKELKEQREQLSAVDKLLEDDDKIINSTITRTTNIEMEGEKDVIIGSSDFDEEIEEGKEGEEGEEKEERIKFIDDSRKKKGKIEESDGERFIRIIVEKKLFGSFIEFINTITSQCCLCFESNKLLFSFWGGNGEYVRVDIPREAFVKYDVVLGKNKYILINPDIDMLAEKIDKMDEYIVIQVDFKNNKLILASKKSSKMILKKSLVNLNAFDMLDNTQVSKLFEKRSPNMSLRWGFKINISELKEIVSLFGKTRKNESPDSYILFVNKTIIIENKEKMQRYLVFANQDDDEYIIYAGELPELYYNKYVYRTDEDFEKDNLTFVKKINLKPDEEGVVRDLLEKKEDKQEFDKKDFVDNLIEQYSSEVDKLGTETEVHESVVLTMNDYKTSSILSKKGVIGVIYAYIHIENLANLFGLNDTMVIEFDAWNLIRPQPLVVHVEKKLVNVKGEEIPEKIKLLYAIPPMDKPENAKLYELKESNMKE